MRKDLTEANTIVKDSDENYVMILCKFFMKGAEIICLPVWDVVEPRLHFYIFFDEE